MKAIIFSGSFEPPQELIDFCEQKLDLDARYIDWSDNEIRFDPAIVKFCEERLSPLWDEMVYKGKDDYRFRVGFAGAGHIRDIDINKPWTLVYSNVDAPIVRYVSTDSYGKVMML